MRDLIDRLLNKSAAQRIGFYGAIEVMEHPWLANVDWKKMKKQNYVVSLSFPFLFLLLVLSSKRPTHRHIIPNLVVVVHHPGWLARLEYIYPAED